MSDSSIHIVIYMQSPNYNSLVQNMITPYFRNKALLQ